MSNQRKGRIIELEWWNLFWKVRGAGKIENSFLLDFSLFALIQLLVHRKTQSSEKSEIMQIEVTKLQGKIFLMSQTFNLFYRGLFVSLNVCDNL